MNVNAGPVDIPSSINETLVFDGAFLGRMNVGTNACSSKDDALKRKVTVTGVGTKFGSSTSGPSTGAGLSSPSPPPPSSFVTLDEELMSSLSLVGGMLVPFVQVPPEKRRRLLAGLVQPSQSPGRCFHTSGGS